MVRPGKTKRWGALTLQLGVLVFLVLPFVSATFRDNDQATILSGAWQVAHHQSSFLHAPFYNLDKQWGTFLLSSWSCALFPHVDLVLIGNIMLTAIGSLAWISLGIRTGRTRTTPLELILPVLLSPALILYLPYLGSGWLSLAFLLLAFFYLGDFTSRRPQTTGFLFLAAASACRADVVLVLPALGLSMVSRGTFQTLIRRRFLWLLASASVVPILVGKWIAGFSSPSANPFSFDTRSYSGFLLFGLTPAMLVILLLATLVYLTIATRKRRRFTFFYSTLALAPLLPFGFYSLQLYGLRYLFLPIAAVLFTVSSRRSVWLYRARLRKNPLRVRRIALALSVATVVPWVVGLSVPTLREPRLTVTDPTKFPTGDGEFPMAGYLGFEWQVLFHDHLQIDHNQKIWLAARSVNYQACPDGSVPFLITPMTNFIELAIRVENKTPRPIDYLAESPCGFAYVDVRSIIRGYRPTGRDGKLFNRQVRFVSSANNGQLIASVSSRGNQTAEGQVLETLRQVLGPHYTEMFVGSSMLIPVQPGLRYVVFSDKPCSVKISGRPVSGDPDVSKTSISRYAWTGAAEREKQVAEASCPAGLAGWAQTTLPPYMGL